MDAAMYTYTVIVEDNFHHMDGAEEYELGKFDSCEAAIAACKKIVDDFLLSSLGSPRSRGELWELFTTFGDSAFLLTADQDCKFSAWNYARERCAELTRSSG